VYCTPLDAARSRYQAAREPEKQSGPEWASFVEHIGKLRQALKRLSENRDVSNPGSQDIREKSMSQTVMEKTAEHIADTAQQASRATSAVADAIEDRVRVVRRTVKQSGDAADELLKDTTYGV
jgi:hypothetical protein